MLLWASEALFGLLDVHAVQAEQILAENLPFRLLGQLRVAVAVDEVLRDLELPERLQGPLRLPDWCLAAVHDLVLAAPEEQLADGLGEHPRRADNEVDGGCERGIEVRMTDELPAHLVEER